MSILNYLTRAYARWKKQQYKNRWDNDFKVLLRDKGINDPFNTAGLHLALLHLNKTPIVEPSIQTRRSLRVYASTTTIDQLLTLLTYAKRLMEVHDNMSSDFFPSEERQLHRFDDYFVSADGHIVSIEKIVVSIEGRLTQLISELEACEVNDEIRHGYYCRKLYPLFCDTFFVLQAIHATSYH